MPAIMKGRVSDTDWELFCEQVNEQLNRPQKYSVVMGALVLLLLLSMMSMFALLIQQIVQIQSDYSSMTVQSDSFVAGFFKFFIITVGLIILIFLLNMGMAASYNAAFYNIKRLCEEESKKEAFVSYHLRDDVIVVGDGMDSSFRQTFRNVFIEVSMSDTFIHGTGNSPNNTPEAVNPTTASQQRTPAQRLQVLEKMKNFLSPQEYDDKRTAILAAV
jgi:hypothetical protein